MEARSSRSEAGACKTSAGPPLPRPLTHAFRFAMSPRSLGSSLGLCTFTATSLPSRRTALCT